MDELIKKYAEKLKNAQVGDYTYEGILAEFAKEVEHESLKELRMMADRLFPTRQ